MQVEYSSAISMYYHKFCYVKYIINPTGKLDKNLTDKKDNTCGSVYT